MMEIIFNWNFVKERKVALKKKNKENCWKWINFICLSFNSIEYYSFHSQPSFTHLLFSKLYSNNCPYFMPFISTLLFNIIVATWITNFINIIASFPWIHHFHCLSFVYPKVLSLMLKQKTKLMFNYWNYFLSTSTLNSFMEKNNLAMFYHFYWYHYFCCMTR